MSKIIWLSIIIIFLIPCFSDAQEVAEQFLVGYWTFDEGTGEKVKDYSGHGNDGEFVGSPKWVDGKYGTALDFGGDGSYVSVKDNDSLDLTDAATYMVWFSLDEPIAGQRRMMSKNDSIFILFDFGDANSIDFLVKPGNDFVESTTIDWKIGEWYHFAGTYNGNMLRIYINGKMEGEKKGVPQIATSDLDLWIGADDWNLPTTSFPGIIDDVRIYSKSLTDTEIRQAMEGPASLQPGGKLPVTWGSLKNW